MTIFKSLYPLLRTLLSVVLVTGSFSVAGQNTLESELKKTGTKTALIVNSQAIDEYPIWSPNSDHIACNIQGKWYKYRLTDITLEEATWHNQKIGILATENASAELTEAEKTEFEKASKASAREVVTSDGTKVELRVEGFSVALAVTKKNKKGKMIWKSGGENCHSLSLSPDEKYVAYLCELNGLLIMKLE